MDWNSYYKNIAEQVKLRSKDENTQIGAVIVGPGNNVISAGYNSFPAGINDEVPERQSREDGEKYYWFEHAERNAIYLAARHGIKLEGSIMYLTCWVPCADCARAIIQAGITKVVCTQNREAQRQKWANAGDRSMQMFNEANVEVEFYD